MFKQITAGSFHTCGLKTGAGWVEKPICWGPDAKNDMQHSHSNGWQVWTNHQFVELTAGKEFTCGRTTTTWKDAAADEMLCWEKNSGANYVLNNGQPGPFQHIGAKEDHVCGLYFDGAIDCWEKNNGPGYDWGKASPNLSGPFTHIAVGPAHGCALDMAGAAVCWGDNGSSQASNLVGPYTQVTAGHYHTCGLKTDGSVTCWGDNSDGQLDVPTP
jgi:alpha-tubulin suppressor-like RCC1 family protein